MRPDLFNYLFFEERRRHDLILTGAINTHNKNMHACMYVCMYNI